MRHISFFTSTKSTASGEGDEIAYLDNVRVEGPIAPAAPATIRDARVLDKSTIVSLTDKLVTAGTDQLTGPFLYVQDNESGGAGIRVRWYDGAMHEGDLVSVQGTLVQASDNGSLTQHNGEREIQGEVVTVHSSGNPLPTFDIGDYLTVTGVVGATSNSDMSPGTNLRNTRLVRPRKAADFVLANPAPAP